MKTTTIKQDAVKYAQENDNILLIHVCNSRAVMGSSIASQIKKAIPSAFTNYRTNCGMGEVSYSNCCSVANMVAQKDYYGYQRNFKKQRFLNYGTLSGCLQQIAGDCELQDLGIDTIALPKFMGSDKAGGDWEIVLELVEYHFEGLFNIVVCEL